VAYGTVTVVLVALFALSCGSAPPKRVVGAGAAELSERLSGWLPRPAQSGQR